MRHRSVERVASAVGESAIAIQLAHEYLTEQLLDIGDKGIHRLAEQACRCCPLMTSSIYRRSRTSVAGLPSRQGTSDGARDGLIKLTERVSQFAAAPRQS